MSLWEKIRKDLEKGVREGVDAFREGAIRMRTRAEELTDEGKRRYALFQLQGDVHRSMTELGGRVYELHERARDAMADHKVISVLKKIKRLETKIARLESASRPDAKKEPMKRRVADRTRKNSRKEKS